MMVVGYLRGNVHIRIWVCACLHLLDISMHIYVYALQRIGSHKSTKTKKPQDL